MAADYRNKKEAAEPSRPGVLLGEVDNATKRFTPRFMLLEFKPSVEWLGSHASESGPRNFQLQVSFPHPYHDCFLQHSVYNSQTDAKVDLLVPRVCPGGLPVTIHLFLVRENDQHQLTQYRAATAYVTVSELVRATETKTVCTWPMINVMGERQCLLNAHDTHFPMPSMAVWSNATPPGMHDADWYTVDPTRKMQPLGDDEVTCGLAPSSRVAEAFRRTHIYFMKGYNMQVWAWCMLEERGPHDLASKNDETITDAYLEHAAETALGWLDLPLEDWLREPTSAKGLEVFCQTLGFYCWQVMYLFDRTWDAERKMFKGFDQFALSRDKTLMALSSGDCEDFTKDMQFVFEGILRRARRKTPPLSPIVATLLSIAQGYCFFITDASIYCAAPAPLRTEPLMDAPKDVNLHMYATLYPWSKVDVMLRAYGKEKELKTCEALDAREVRRTHGWPVISLESTELNYGNWDLEAPAMLPFVERANAFASKAGSPELSNVLSTIRLHNTGKGLMSTQFYRLDLCLYSLQLYRMCNIHSLLPVRPSARDEKQWTYGVPKIEMMDKNARTALAVCGYASYAAVASVLQLTDRMPLLRTLDYKRELTTGTTMPRQLRSQAGGGRVVRLFARAWDWSPRKEAVLMKILEGSGYGLLGPSTSVAILDDFSVVQFDIEAT